MMGGRGASSDMSAKGKPYGSEYRTVYQAGNIKFITPTDGQVKAPLETMTEGRVYVTIGSDGEPRYISYYDKRDRKNKQIDVRRRGHTIAGKLELPHTHKGYIHSEKGTFVPSPKEEND